MIKRIFVLILTCAILISTLHGVYAYTNIPDGYVEEENTDGEAVVFKGSDEAQAQASKLISSSEVLSESGENTSKFTAGVGTTTFPNVPKTLKYKYDTLNVKLYSKKATGDKLFILINSPKTSGLNYYKFTTNIDWEGWKEFDIRVDTLGAVRSPSTENLSHITISLMYDECVPSLETVLYIDTIKFVCRLDSTKSGGYSAVVFPVELANEFYDLSENTLCYYNYRKYVYLDKEHYDIDNRETTAENIDGVSMMPSSFFKEYFNAEVKVNDSNVIIKKDGKTIDVAIGNKIYLVDGEKKEFDVAPFKSKSVVMIPVGAIIEEFGQKLVSVGNINFIDPKEELVNRLNDSKEFYNLAKFKIAHKNYAVENVKDEDFLIAIKNYRSALIGENNDMTNPFIAEKVKNIEESGRKSWESMDKNAANGVMWGEKAAGLSNFVSVQFSNISNMCKAYACVGSGLYKNKELFNDIVLALDFASADFYGPSARKQANRYGNWWYWMIGGPTQLINALMCICDDLTDEQIDEYLATIDAIMPTVRYTGGNMAWSVYIVMGAGVLQHDAEKVLKAAEKLSEFWAWGEGTDDGVYYDGTIIQHHVYPYNGGYGANLINDLSNSVMALANTTLFPTDPNIETQVEWVKKCFVPVIYNGHIMQSFTGRNMAKPTSSSSKSASTIISGMLQMLHYVNPVDAAYLKSYIKAQAIGYGSDRMCSSMPISEIQNLIDILNDDSIEPMNISISRTLFNGDRICHFGNGFAANVSMSSERIADYESLTGVGGKSWYTGDGMLYIYNDSDNEEYGSEYFADVDWTRLSGTTVDKTPRPDIIAGAELERSPESFVGGASVDDKYSAGAMRFHAYTQQEEKTYYASDTGITYTLPVFDNDLVANKSWFMFEDEVVALGAGITSTKDPGVETIVDNKLLKKDDNGSEEIIVNGENINGTKAYTKTVDNVKSAYVENFGGYYFPNAENLTFNRTENNYIQIYKNHGVNPQNDTYNYVILPNMTKEEVEQYTANPKISVLANTDKVQAVSKPSVGVTQIVFWSAGTFNGITVDKPCIVIIRENEGRYVLGVSDPTQKESSINVTIDRADISFVKADKGITFENGILSINLETSLDDTYAGDSFKGITYQSEFSVANNQ